MPVITWWRDSRVRDTAEELGIDKFMRAQPAWEEGSIYRR